MQLQDIMTRAVVTVDLDTSLARIKEIFDEKRFHHVLVIDEGRVMGVIQDRDLLAALSPFIGNPLMERRQDEATLDRRAHQIMSRAPVVGASDMDVREAILLLLERGVTCLPVIAPDGRLEGLVTWRDLVAVVAGDEHGRADRGDARDAA